MLVSVVLWLSLPTAFDFSAVFGIEIGTDSPGVLERRFGSSTRVVRHYWNEKWKSYDRDDGWNWWNWEDGNAEIQCYWEPAYPAKKRRITRMWIVEADPKFDGRLEMKPHRDEVGWLEGIRMGMPIRKAIDLLGERLGPPRQQFWNTYTWTSNKAELSAHCNESRALCELSVSSRE